MNRVDQTQNGNAFIAKTGVCGSAWMALAFLLLTSASCTHALHVVHEGDIDRIPTGREFRRVKSQSEQFVVLGFVQQTDYVNQAFRDLAKQCPGHEVEGIQTRYSTSHGFLSWTNKVVMQGYCLE